MSLTLLDFKIADDILAKEMGEIFLQLLPTRTVLFPDTKEVLQYLTGKGYELHLITNALKKPSIVSWLHRVEHFFKKVITSEGSNSMKPEKEIFDYALNSADAKAHESIMIGDALDIDIAGAMNAGMDQVHTNYTNVVQH
jgi:putative hydrolase of the HAD superfamily